jgi:hypothetical protein
LLFANEKTGDDRPGEQPHPHSVMRASATHVALHRARYDTL